MVTDLPNELMSALSQGLSQFGINLPAMPSALTGADAGMPTTLTAPGSLGRRRAWRRPVSRLASPVRLLPQVWPRRPSAPTRRPLRR